MKCFLCAVALASMLVCAASAGAAKQDLMRSKSVFYPTELLQRLRANVARDEDAAVLVRGLVAAARPWREMSDEQLWGLMFSPTIPRSWMVWSDGHCPACNKSVPMYKWKMDALAQPWKVWCPHCGEHFPKNDFAAYYRSGLDSRGVFDPAKANRALLFNADHPDAEDPLREFGVDDGWGYARDGKRWRFIGAYLVHGQWKQAALGGVNALAQAYVATGEGIYAHKAAILLDRIADMYPEFDFGKQGVVYENSGSAGYVSTWDNSCEETRELALAYDMIQPSLEDDRKLVAFLSAQARRHGLENPKTSVADIRRNIETRILRDALANPHKLHSNYPRQDIALILIRAVLGEPRETVNPLIDSMLERATAVDGVTGEKGLANYSAYVIQSLAEFLALWDRADHDFLSSCLELQPRLRQTYRFHIDTWCLGKFYPLVGDTGWFAQEIPQYGGVLFRHPASAPLVPSMYSFLWRLYQLTGDPAFAQVLYLANGRTLDGLPHDPFADDEQTVRDSVARLIAEHGPTPVVGSVNKEQWRLAILRSGAGENERAAWLNYGVGGGHHHQDGLNLGLFAYGLDLMPEFGYPPVQFGGWGSPKAAWYRTTAAHNTVVVDRQDQRDGVGKTTLWAEGKVLRAVRVAAPDLLPVDAGDKRFERTVVMVDAPDPGRFYMLDLFRVTGGSDHAFFLHGNADRVETVGLNLTPGGDYAYGPTQMRSFRQDAQPRPGWQVQWQLGDSPVRLRYTGLTEDAAVVLCEGWVTTGGYDSSNEAWIPRLMVRRQGEALSSMFVGVIEPCVGTSALNGIRRVPLLNADGQPAPTGAVAVEVTHADGTRDLLVAADADVKTATLRQTDWQLSLDGEFCLVRRTPEGEIAYCAAADARVLRCGDLTLKNGDPAVLLEWSRP